MAKAVHDTFVIERTYPRPRPAVFDAFADPAKRRRWYTAGREEATEAFEADFRVGGHDRLAMRMGPQTPIPGVLIENRTTYQEITHERRIVLTQAMDMDGRRFSVALITFELEEAGEGTLLRLTHQCVFLEGADGPAMRQQGWRELLDHLPEALA